MMPGWFWPMAAYIIVAGVAANAIMWRHFAIWEQRGIGRPFRWHDAAIGMTLGWLLIPTWIIDAAIERVYRLVHGADE